MSKKGVHTESLSCSDTTGPSCKTEVIFTMDVRELAFINAGDKQVLVLPSENGNICCLYLIPV